MPTEQAAMRGPPGGDLDAIVAEVLAEHGWLRELDRGQEIADIAALRLAWARVAVHAADRAGELPEPDSTIVSRQRDARRRARQRWHDRAEPAIQALRALPATITVADLTPLLAPELRAPHSAPDSAAEVAGRAAMIPAIAARRGRVRIDVRRGQLRLLVELDGARLALRHGRIPFDAFFETTSPPLLAIQRAYHHGKARHGRAELARHTDDSPWLAAALLGEQISERRQAAVDEFLARDGDGRGEQRRRDDGPEAIELRGTVNDQRERAERIRATATAAVAPLVMVAGFFAIEGAADLFLAAFPFGKAARLIKGLRRGKGAAKLSKARRAEVVAALSGDERRFMTLVGKLDDAGQLGPAELHALATIAEQVAGKLGDPEVINHLLVQAVRGQADLAWIARKLDAGTFDPDFIAHFMRYDANPTWAQLRRLLDDDAGRLDADSRSSVTSKLLGFLGEQAAARHVHTEAFTRRFFPRGPAPTVFRGHEALDLMMLGGDKGQILAAEVKNWSVETWHNSSQIDGLFKQLDRHNKTIDALAKEAHDRKVVGRVLLVTERGFMELSPGQRNIIRQKVQMQGWTIEVIPGEKIESMAQFIDRMRKGES